MCQTLFFSRQNFHLFSHHVLGLGRDRADRREVGWEWVVQALAFIGLLLALPSRRAAHVDIIPSCSCLYWMEHFHIGRQDIGAQRFGFYDGYNDGHVFQVGMSCIES